MRTRNETGSVGDVVGAVAITVILLALPRVLWDVDLIGYLEAAVDWCVALIERIFDNPKGERRG